MQNLYLQGDRGWASELLPSAIYPPKKTMLTFLHAAWMLAPLCMVADMFFNDADFIVWLAMLIGMDTILGIAWAWKTKTLSSKAMIRIPVKVAIYAMALQTTHILVSFTVKGKQPEILNMILPYIDSVMYTYIVLREVISINENLGKFGFSILPTWVIKRFNDFTKEGKYVPNSGAGNIISTPEGTDSVTGADPGR